MSVADEETRPGAVPLTLFSKERKAIFFCKSLPEMFSLRVFTTLYDVANINPLSPNSDQHQISSCNINAYSTS